MKPYVQTCHSRRVAMAIALAAAAGWLCMAPAIRAAEKNPTSERPLVVVVMDPLACRCRAPASKGTPSEIIRSWPIGSKRN